MGIRMAARKNGMITRLRGSRQTKMPAMSMIINAVGL